MKALALSFGLLVPVLGAAQQKTSLGQFLATHPVPNGFAVGAESVSGSGNSLAQFGRKAVKLGGITAIVPVEMVRFEDAPKAEPNLYDGLPRNTKVLYLMTTLTPEQWRLAGGKGIGINDLSGDQKNIFVSLMPKSLRWQRIRAAEDQGIQEVDKGEVAGADLPKVRLKIEQRLQYLIPLAERDNSYTSRDPDTDSIQPGQEFLRRDNADDRNPKDAYGVEVRATVPNVLKKGQLNTSGLDATVEVPAKATVGSVLERVGAATGLEIYADIRVRGLSVAFPEGKGRAGDLLDALALAVTGTYRKLGNAYLLVADVTGAGARKLRFALWEDEIDDLVQQRERDWRAAIAKSGLIRNAKLDVGDPLQSTEGIEGHLEKKPGMPGFFPTEELSADQRTYLTRTLASDKEGRYRRDRVGIESNIKYRFILPNGKPLQAEGYLGPEWLFRPFPTVSIHPDPAVPLTGQPEGISRPLVVSAANAAEAKAGVETAKAFGFTELWVRTDRKEALTAAVGTGFPVRFFARPWESTAADPDRTMLGESGRAVFNRMAGSAAWADLARMVRMQSWPRHPPVTVAGDFISPFHPQWPATRTRLADLGRTSGLAGVVLTEAMPHGYEGKEDNSTVGSYGPASVEMWAFGYDVPARLEFFRAKGFDPIDLPSERTRFDVDMFTPFFGRYPQGVRVIDQAWSDWIAFRAKANATALNELGTGLGEVPVLIDTRRSTFSQPPLHAATLRRWKPGNLFPTYEGQYILTQEEGQVLLLSAPWPQMADALTDFTNAAKVYGSRKDQPLAVDITRIPSSQWAELLGRSFIRK